MIKSNIFFLLEKEHIFSSIDIQFAIFINSFYRESMFLILLSLYLSKHTRRGNIALSLSGLYALICKDKYYSPIIRNFLNKINENNKIEYIQFYSANLLIFDKVIIPPSKDRYGPIILYKDYLYFYKVWYSLNRVRFFFKRTAYYDKLEKLLLTENIVKYLFNKFGTGYKFNYQQNRAILMSLLNIFTIITGGPGTGKTSLIIQIIKNLMSYYKKKNLFISLLAPTGKATVKLIYLFNDLKSNRFADNKIFLNIEDISTLHKRLKKTKLKEELLVPSNNILDVLILDEASMVNLYLMDKLINNLLSHKTKFILIGDPYQLNAVASVGILRNILHWINHFSKQRLYKFNQYIKDYNYRPDNIVVLKDVYRFAVNSGIAILAKAIKEENFSLIEKIYLRQNQFNDITWYSWGGDLIYKLLINHCVYNCNKLIKNINNKKENINSIINYLNEFQILCLLNKGPYGVDTINDMVELNLSYRSKNYWYNGRPIIILKNDPDLLLSNGEIGITLLNNILGEWEVIFLANNSNKGLKLRRVKLKDIKHFKTAWSITIHKAQGSEYNKVILILPPIVDNIYKHNRHNYIYLITKELIYTAITRAKHRLIIYANIDAFLWGVKHNDMSGRFIR